MSESVFWMVWCENGGVPTAKHPTFASARSEAERLARMHTGKRFHVLMAVGSCRKNEVEWLPAVSNGAHVGGCLCDSCIPF